MKSKSLFFVIVLLFSTNILLAQGFAVDKGAVFISGLANFSNKSGELYDNVGGNSLTNLNFTPDVNFFIMKNLFLGAGLDFAYQKRGSYKSNNIGIGPQIGYAIGNETSNFFPYFAIGLKYYGRNIDYGSNSTKGSGTDISFSPGIIVPVKTHIGIAFNCSYHLVNIREKGMDSAYNGNTFTVGIGIVGLLF